MIRSEDLSNILPDLTKVQNTNYMRKIFKRIKICLSQSNFNRATKFL